MQRSGVKSAGDSPRSGNHCRAKPHRSSPTRMTTPAASGCVITYRANRRSPSMPSRSAVKSVLTNSPISPSRSHPDPQRPPDDAARAVRADHEPGPHARPGTGGAITEYRGDPGAVVDQIDQLDPEPDLAAQAPQVRKQHRFEAVRGQQTGSTGLTASTCRGSVG